MIDLVLKLLSRKRPTQSVHPAPSVLSLQSEYDAVTTEYLEFRNVFERNFSLSSNEMTLIQMRAWLGKVLKFLDRIRVESSPDAYMFRQAVTTKNRAVEVLERLAEIGQPLVEIQREIEKFPSKFSYDMGRGRNYEFHMDFFSQHVEAWKKDLRNLIGKDGNQILEIGCLEGFSTSWILENLISGSDARLVCADLFEDAMWFRLFGENLQASGKASQVVIQKGRSQAILRTLSGEPRFDFVHVDGSHLSCDCLEDLILVWPMLKVGGIVIVDDYQLFHPESSRQPVADATNVFVDFFAEQLTILRKDSQIVLQKRAHSNS